MSKRHHPTPEPAVLSSSSGFVPAADLPVKMTDKLAVEDAEPLGGLAPLPGIVSGEDASSARRISIWGADKKRKATALVTLAEESSLAARLRLPRSALATAVVVSDVLVDADAADFVAPLVYLCGRRGRIFDRPMVLTAFAEDASTEARTRWLPDLERLPNLDTLESVGRAYQPFAQRLDIVVHRAYAATADREAQQSPPGMLPLLRAHFVGEAVEVLDRWIDSFFQTPWFQAVRSGTLTKQQYIYTLSNMHQFVRWTTRLIGLAVGASNDPALRSKWLDHLREEVDHERIIERDLAALGADVRFVTDSMTPTVINQQFMVAQESMIGFHRNPVLFAATPFAAEGFAARLDAAFLDALRRNAKSWGIENPKTVTAFMASHMEYDGGDDGHWESNQKMLADNLRTDLELRQFLNVARLAMDSIERSYTAYVTDLALFSATSAKA